MSLNRKALLLVLATYMNEDGWCWVSLARLVEITGLGMATVCRNLKAAELEGWITRKTGGRNLHGGKNTATEYTALVPNPLSHSPLSPPLAGNTPIPPIPSLTYGASERAIERALDQSQSQVLALSPQGSERPIETTVEEVQKDEQTRRQERAPREKVATPSTSNRSGNSSQPSSFDARSSDPSKGDPPPPGWSEDWRRLLDDVKVPA